MLQLLSLFDEQESLSSKRFDCLRLCLQFLMESVLLQTLRFSQHKFDFYLESFYVCSQFENVGLRGRLVLRLLLVSNVQVLAVL